MLGVSPLNHPICFTHPSRVATSSRLGHVPFGMYIIDLLRPKALAELGTHDGVSYCASCQAVKELGLDTRCYGIDTWPEDAQAGVHGPEVLADLQEHHNPLYGSFSRLIQSNFDEALNCFADKTFDLLQFSGCQTYEEVKADFENWLPKMTERGVVLFHGISIRELDHGVSKLWDELKLQYSSFEFVHSHGMGVLAVGHDYPEEFNALLHCSEAEAISVRRFFSYVGARLETAQELQSAKPELERLKAQRLPLNAQIEEATQRISVLTGQLQERDAQIREQGSKLLALKAQLGDLTRQQGELQQRVSEQDLLIGDKDLQLYSAIKQAEENQHRLQTHADQITVLTQELKDKGVKAGQTQHELQAQQLAEQTRQELHDQLQQITLLTQTLKERDAKTEQNRLELQAQAQEITGLRQELKDRDVRLKSATLQIRTWERRTQELAHLLAGVEDIRHTGSYRLVRALSSPLRWKYRATLRRFLYRVNGSQTNNKPGLKSPKEKDVPFGISTNPHTAKKEFIDLPQSEAHGGGVSDAESCLRDFPWIYNNISTREAALFDAEWYLLENPDVAEAKVDPLVHYLRWGSNEGRAPHPLFHPKFYLKTYPEAAMAGGGNALKHYLTEGWTKGYKPNPKFDPAFYLMTYPDIAQAGKEPLTHFITNGLREGRCACPEDVTLETYEGDFEISREPIAAASTVTPDVKAIAFYLPQFHPIPENDEWWGTGFTEWTNVRRGEPQFKDHYQPHVPSDLDYYDLREPDVLEQQAALAQEYGIYGFCFYYYWFVGKILLDLPLRRMLETGKPDFPFCICWANENWTRRWDGQENEVLIGQQHSPEDDLAFLRNIESILLHKNYIRVEGKPLLIVYRPSILPDAKATAERWREAFRAEGHGEIFLAAAQTFAHRPHPHEYGFDAIVQFPPHATCVPITTLTKGVNKSFSGHIYDYNQTKWTFIDELYQLSSSRPIFPGIMPSWDNTARRRNKSNVWINSSPESYYDWLRQATSFLRRTKPNDEKLVFINAWNEWAEGCHLEPDQTFGYAWLNATRLALQSEGTATD